MASQTFGRTNHSTIVSGFLSIASSYGVMALSLVSGFLLARMLGVENRGTLASVLLWPSILAHAGDLGGPIAYAFRSASKPSEIEKLTSQIIPIVFVQTAILLAIGLPVVTQIMRSTQGPTGLATAYMIVAVPLNLYARYQNSLNQGRRDFVRLAIVRTSLQASYTLLLIASFLAGIASVSGAVLAMTLATVVWAFTSWRMAEVRTRPKLRLDRNSVRGVFSYGIRAHLGNLAPLDFLQLDLAFVILTLGATSSGLYTVASSSAGVLRAIGVSMGLLALPLIAASEQDEDRSRRTAQMIKVTACGVVGPAILLVALAPLLIPTVFGVEFGTAVPIVQVLAFAMIFAALKQVMSDTLRGAGRPALASCAELCGLLVFFVVAVATHKRLAEVGVAVSALTAYATTLLILLMAARQSSLLNPSDMKPSKQDLQPLGQIVASMVQRLRQAIT